MKSTDIKIHFLTITLSIFLSSSCVLAQDITVVTSTWAPYNMEEDGKATGIGTEIVQDVLDKAGIKADIEFYPWARAFRLATKRPNTMIYTIIMIEERESLFQWIGPIISVKSVLHKLKKRTDIKLNALEDAKKYRISTTRDAAGHQFLLKRGFKDNQHIHVQNSNERSVMLLFRERVDLESSVDLNFMYEAKRQGFPYKNIEQAWVLFENKGYMAFSKSTPKVIVKRVQTAYEHLKSAGVVDAILEKYLALYN